MSNDKVSLWEVRIGETVYGPYDWLQLQAYVASGRVGRESEVRSPGETEWLRAGARSDLKDLFVAEAATSSMIVVVDLRIGSSLSFETAITNLGPTYRLTSTVWLLAAKTTAGAVRNVLQLYLGKGDTLFVADATNGKAAWHNFGPEADARIRGVWQKG